MNNNDKNNLVGCLGLSIGALILIALGLFICPAIVMKAWDMIAVEHFNLPHFTYWECFWATFAIRALFKTNVNTTNNSN